MNLVNRLWNTTSVTFQSTWIAVRDLGKSTADLVIRTKNRTVTLAQALPTKIKHDFWEDRIQNRLIKERIKPFYKDNENRLNGKNVFVMTTGVALAILFPAGTAAFAGMEFVPMGALLGSLGLVAACKKSQSIIEDYAWQHLEDMRVEVNKSTPHTLNLKAIQTEFETVKKKLSHHDEALKGIHEELVNLQGLGKVFLKQTLSQEGAHRIFNENKEKLLVKIETLQELISHKPINLLPPPPPPLPNFNSAKKQPPKPQPKVNPNDILDGFKVEEQPVNP